MLLRLYPAIILALFLGALVSMPAYAQSQKQAADPMTLPQALDTAYKNNKNLLIYQEKITQAQGKVDETVSNLYPTLTFDLAYNRASQSFLFGPVPTVSNSESLDKKVSLTQPLYTGTRTTKGINISQLSLENSRDDYLVGQITTNLAVIKAYYDLLKAQKLVDVAQSGVAQAQSHLDVVNRQLAGATGGRAEVLKANARVQLLTNQQNLIRSEQSMEISTYTFANTVGIPKESVPPLVDVDLPDPLPVISLEEGISQSKNRIEFRQLKRAQDIARYTTEITQENWSLLPTVTLTGSYNAKNYTTVGATSNDWMAVVDANWTIWNGNKTPAQVVQNQSLEKQNQLSYQQLEENITLEVHSAYLTLVSAEKQLSISKEAASAAKLNLDLADDLFNRGVGTDADLRDAESSNLQAQSIYVSSKYDYLYALASWKKAVGSLL